MIGVLQRLLQLIVLGGLILVIAKPQVVPPPAQQWAQAAHVWVVGESDTWQSFQSTWQQRFEWLGSLIPWFKALATTIPPDPPQITADGIVHLFRQLIIIHPLRKLDTIKQDIMAPPTIGTPAASIAPVQ